LCCYIKSWFSIYMVSILLSNCAVFVLSNSYFLYDTIIFIINVCYYIVYHQLLTLSKLPSFMFCETWMKTSDRQGEGVSGNSLLWYAQSSWYMGSVLFWVIMQWVVVISYQRFRTTYQSHLQRSRNGTGRVSQNVSKKLPLCNNPEEHSSLQLHCRSLKSCIVCVCVWWGWVNIIQH